MSDFRVRYHGRIVEISARSSYGTDDRVHFTCGDCCCYTPYKLAHERMAGPKFSAEHIELFWGYAYPEGAVDKSFDADSCADAAAMFMVARQWLLGRRPKGWTKEDEEWPRKPASSK